MDTTDPQLMSTCRQGLHLLNETLVMSTHVLTCTSGMMPRFEQCVDSTAERAVACSCKKS